MSKSKPEKNTNEAQEQKRIVKSINLNTIKPEPGEKTLEELTEEEKDKAIKSFLGSIDPKFFDALNKLIEEYEIFEKQITPYIEKEIKRGANDPKLNNITFDEVIDNLTISGHISDTKSRSSLILERALTAWKKDQEKKEKRGKFSLREPIPEIFSTIILNDAVNHKISSSDFIEQTEKGLIMRGYKANQAKKGATPVNVAVILTYMGDNNLKMSRPSNAYDDALECAICSISLRNEETNGGTFKRFFVTPEDIYRAMTGTQSKNIKLSPAQKDRIREGIYKLKHTDITADLSEEIRKHDLKIEEGERIVGGGMTRSRLYTGEDFVITEKGRKIFGFWIEKEPFFLTYNRAKISPNNPHGHVIYLPLDILNTAGNEGNTIEIRKYLLGRIIQMYNEPKYSHRIKYETMYQSGIDAPEERISPDKFINENSYKAQLRKEKAKDREKVCEILDAWKEKKFIKDYKQVQQGNPKEFKSGLPFIGVDITLNPNAPQLKNING